jgi:hypothetical protein
VKEKERLERCSVCGVEHPRSELEWYFVRPDPVVAIPKRQRGKRCKENDDLCAIDSKRYFVRGVLPLPVEGWDHSYQIGIWVEVKLNDFRTIVEHWTDEGQSSMPPFEGTLANDISLHEDTLGLEVRVALTGPTTRPEIYIVDTRHDLYHEQNNGISSHRAYEYSSLF